MLLRVDAKNW